MKLVYQTTPTKNLENFSRLAKCFGITAEFLGLQNLDRLASVLEAAVSAGHSDIVLDVASLKEKWGPKAMGEAVKVLTDRDTSVLLLISDSDDFIKQFLQCITDRAVGGVKQASRAGSIYFPANSIAFSRELSSCSFSRKPGSALVLEAQTCENVNGIMFLDQSPSFVQARLGRANIFIWSTNEVFDIHKPLAAEMEFEEAADEYIPAIIYLRFVFGEQCWHNPNAGAGAVIDDPLLKKHYGFIKFPQLLESAKTHGYHVTLGFIPWNHWRSSPKQVELFRRYSSCFSMCTHGCDHSNNEFKSADYDELLSKNFVASQRMQRHMERTGLQCEPLMVCPQEQYSLEAMRAFADSRQFIGLVCTSCIPRNLSAPQITGADLLLPAQDSFFGFPVFKRHYWRDGLSGFAMDLFLGKHAILAEHHEFFKDGPGNMEEFAVKLAKLRPDIKWTSLAETAIGTHLIRHLAENQREVRFFTDVFRFEHKSDEPLVYRFIRRLPETSAVQRVLMNGVPIAVKRQNGFLTFDFQAARRQTLRIQVECMSRKPNRLYSFGIKYKASVACRRFLSEFRDNVIVRNEMALRASRFLARTLKQTAN